MPELSIQYLKSYYGELILGDFEGKLCLCDWRYRRMRSSIDKRLLSGLDATYVERDTDLLATTRQQLSEYFAAERKTFELPLRFVGSEFQQQVWAALLRVPYGETSTYLELSHAIDNAKAVRAVASANGANALSIFVPCHRIVGSDGSLVGYAGGLAAKRKLLELERPRSESKPESQLSLSL